METENFIEPKEIKRKDWSLIYNPEFGEYKERYANIISKVFDVMEGGSAAENMSLELIRKTESEKSYFLLTIDGEKFFVKKMPDRHKQSGVEEFVAAKEAKKRLKENNILGVRVIDYVFAFTGKEFRYTVSRYDENTKIDMEIFLKEVESRDVDLSRYLQKKIFRITEILSDYEDVTLKNMGYDESTGEMVLYDLNINESGLIHSDDEDL